MDVLPYKLPLIIVVALYKQIGVADSKYGVLDDSQAHGHVTRRMCIANFAIKTAHSHCFQPLLSNGSR